MQEIQEARKEWIPLVEAKIEAFFDQWKRECKEFSHHHCVEMAAYQFSTGGKRLRALIPSLVYSAMGSEDSKDRDAISIGAAIEMIHNATLVHDDYQDGDRVRRGKPTVWNKYSGSQAINAGDAMFYYAPLLLNDLQAPADVKARVQNRVLKATLEVIEGQAQEFLTQSEPQPNLSRYRTVVRGKTAALFSACFVAPLESLSIEESVIEAVKETAMEVGTLFQIQDDLLDVYGEKGRDQKATDIAEGKLSYLVAHVYEVGAPHDRQRLQEILKTPRDQTTPDQIEEAISLFEKYEAKQRAVMEICQIQRSLSENQKLDSLPEIRTLLSEIADLFLEPLRGVI